MCSLLRPVSCLAVIYGILLIGDLADIFCMKLLVLGYCQFLLPRFVWLVTKFSTVYCLDIFSIKYLQIYLITYVENL